MSPSRAPRLRRRQIATCLLSALLLACHDGGLESDRQAPWSREDLKLLASLALTSLPDPPESLSNRFADDDRAVELGRRLFFDPKLSRDGSVSCATCHLPDRYFTDGLRTSQGLARGRRNAQSVVGAAFSPWLFWDGRRDSLWSQALAPIETEAEMGNTRLAAVRHFATDPAYADDYRALFGRTPGLLQRAGLPEHAGPFGSREARANWSQLSGEERDQINHAFANLGKAIAAYERRLRPGEARFDRYVEAVLEGDVDRAAEILTQDEIAGARLFLDGQRTQCLRCHNGPLFSNHSFHDIGTGRLGEVPDLGRLLGLESLRLDAFNCLGRYSDAPDDTCGELRFLGRQSAGLSGAFRTPSLRNVSQTAPYFHNGSHDGLDAVLDYYRSPPLEPPNELTPLELSERESQQLVAFLATLSGGFVERPARSEMRSR